MEGRHDQVAAAHIARRDPAGGIHDPSWRLSANRLTEHLGVPPNRISAILKGDRAITADTALRLANCFATTPEFWMNLQVLYELEVARRMSAKVIARTVRPIGPIAA